MNKTHEGWCKNKTDVKATSINIRFKGKKKYVNMSPEDSSLIRRLSSAQPACCGGSVCRQSGC